MNNSESFVNAGFPAPSGPFSEDASQGGSRPATLLVSQPELSGLLMNLNQRLIQLESSGSTNISHGYSSLGMPKVGLPERFGGSISRCRDFLLSVENVFALQPQSYPSDVIKTRFIGTLLTNEALSWFRDIVERKPFLLDDYNSFISDFKAYFDDPNAKRHAAASLVRLKQGKGSVLTFATKFRRLSYDTGFNNDALVYIPERIE